VIFENKVIRSVAVRPVSFQGSSEVSVSDFDR
jgi:hypothetical protein